jgi:hypothetical protein
MIKVNGVAAALAAGTALLLVIGLAFPSRVSAQTPAQGQALGILLLLGLGPRPAAQPPADAKKPDGAVKKAAPADAKKPDGVAKKAAPTSGKPVRLTSDLVNGRMVVRSVEVTDGPRAKQD